MLLIFFVLKGLCTMGLTSFQLEGLEKGSPNMAEVKVKASGIPGQIPSNTPMDFASNSNKLKQNPEKKVTKIAQGRVTPVKKSAGRRISETFLADDAKNVVSYIFREVLIPAAKTTLSDLVSTGIDRLLYGGEASAVKRRYRNTGATKVSYGGYFKEPPNDNRYFREHTNAPSRASTITTRRVRQSFEDIVLDERIEAEEVLTTLIELVDQYGIATIADFYDLVGLETTFVDFKYGWDNVSRVDIVRVRDGYVINLPRPIQL